MKKKLYLYLLYRITGDESNSMLEVLNVFSDSGAIPEKWLQVAREKTGLGEKNPAFFPSLERMAQFALALDAEAGSQGVLLLSTADYNLGLDNCSNVEEFKDIFQNYGELLQDSSQNQRKNSLFDKFFR